MKTVLIVIISLMIVSMSQAQWKNSTVIFPETKQSDPFKVPLYYSFCGIDFANKIDKNMDTVFFWVSYDAVNYSPLYYDGAKYIEVIPDSTVVPGRKAITLKITRTFPWEWWKIGFTETMRDSVRFIPIFEKIK